MADNVCHRWGRHPWAFEPLHPESYHACPGEQGGESQRRGDRTCASSASALRVFRPHCRHFDRRVSVITVSALSLSAPHEVTDLLPSCWEHFGWILIPASTSSLTWHRRSFRLRTSYLGSGVGQFMKVARGKQRFNPLPLEVAVKRLVKKHLADKATSGEDTPLKFEASRDNKSPQCKVYGRCSA